jgi:hypothetical protein
MTTLFIDYDSKIRKQLSEMLTVRLQATYLTNINAVKLLTVSIYEKQDIVNFNCRIELQNLSAPILRNFTQLLLLSRAKQEITKATHKQYPYTYHQFLYHEIFKLYSTNSTLHFWCKCAAD